jgi:hypothetical protein
LQPHGHRGILPYLRISGCAIGNTQLNVLIGERGIIVYNV